MKIKNVGCPCSGCMRKADAVIKLIDSRIDSLKWVDEESYHPPSHHMGYLKAIKDVKDILGVDYFWMDICSCHMCILARTTE